MSLKGADADDVVFSTVPFDDRALIESGLEFAALSVTRWIDLNTEDAEITEPGTPI